MSTTKYRIKPSREFNDLVLSANKRHIFAKNL